MQLTRERILQELSKGNDTFGYQGYELIEALNGTILDNEVIGRGRWEINYRTVIELSKDDYSVYIVVEYAVGATEDQEVEDWCTAYFAEPVEEVVVRYRRIGA